MRLIGLFVLFLMLHACNKSVVVSVQKDSPTFEKNVIYPMVIAHRGGQLEAPENTLYAFDKAIKIGVDGIELDVQLSKDLVPVLYHPKDLSAKTNEKGPVSSLTVAELKQLNAGYNFTSDGQNYPFRGDNSSLGIPTLEEAFKNIPKNIFIIIDFKSLPAGPLVDAVLKTVDATNEWDRVLFYSTSNEHMDILAKENRAILFEPRDITRSRLLQMAIHDNCDKPLKYYPWMGFELNRKMTVSEKFQLGEGHTTLDMNLWNEKTMQCIKEAQTKCKVSLFGINTKEDYISATKLGVDAVYTDCPEKIVQIKNAKTQLK